MSGKDYYAILGVTPETSMEDIRTAFRRLAKRYHPDGNDNGDNGRFGDIAEAYAVLSDPDKRRRYHQDRQRAAAHRRSRVRNVHSWPGAYGGKKSRGESPLEQMMRNMFRNRMVAGGGTLIELEVVLDPREAREGVAAKLDVPMPRVCEACGGRGDDGLVQCGHCGGRGLRRVMDAVSVRFPAGVTDGSVFDVPLARGGLAAGTLRLYVWVVPD
jgi:molecular chaperone DnaJ